MTFNEKEFKDESKKEIMDQLMQELYKLGDEVMEESQHYLDVVNKTTDTGALAGSAKVFKQENQVIVSYNSPYAADIEYGTDPHYVDPRDLEPWVRRKLKIIGRRTMMVARKVSNKIMNEGTNPQPFLRPILNKLVAEGKLKYEMTGEGSVSGKVR
jgi:spore cortex formation protein SpoVR/YcgB (stage V sporulation)